MKLGLLGRLAGSSVGSAAIRSHPAQQEAAPVSGSSCGSYCIAQTRAILVELSTIDHCGKKGCRFRDFARMGGKRPMVKPRLSKTA
ncbi:hypothetical protein [Cupriavidus lacunae]|uniref:hypothetical protein n=1 Tax=Cupriavidus lacunae TaxID=2666307 RepID=UPI0010583E52|nr:hypothetical protein [Cupriavidus lacunae]